MWNKLDKIATSKHASQGLSPMVAAGMVCLEAEKFAPGLFRAISLKNGVMTLQVDLQKRLNLTLIEGSLLAHLKSYATARNLPSPSRFRLTIPSE
ncbi:hypothetical protein BH11PAT4_BH11PAT4_5800 [soil metagenome]